VKAEVISPQRGDNIGITGSDHASAQWKRAQILANCI
jgi:hypothetical protein